MSRIVFRRLATSVPTIIVSTILVFALRYLLPGGPVEAMLGGGTGQYTAKQIAAIEARLGLNAPVPVQYWHWLTGVLHGNLGTSYYSQQPVTTVIAPRVIPSLELIIGALIVSTVIGGGLGILAAAKRGHPAGRAVQLGTGLGLSVPDFWLAAVAAGVLGLTWNIFPAVGFTPISQSLSGNIDTLALPVLVLSVVTGSFLARQHQGGAAALGQAPQVVQGSLGIGFAGPGRLDAAQTHIDAALGQAAGQAIAAGDGGDLAGAVGLGESGEGEGEEQGGIKRSHGAS